MAQASTRYAARLKRHGRIRLTVSGTPARPRLAVFRSLDHIYAQVIDDTVGHTMAAASSMEKELRAGGGSKIDRAQAVGRLLAERAKAAGISQVVFDRAGYRYHGRVRSLAEAARAAGLDF
ncbi:MAG: 50S ribosomal protein L18 [Chloroflexota bacterium]|jgi:large subunit ribosomal protein L18|nr:MAG: 50S ribosomal protein L18 [Chloroflexota bacterium]